MATDQVGKRGYFAEWLNALPDSRFKVLPLTHITATKTAQEIIDAGKIEPKQCDVFGVPILYCYYGRSAYRMGKPDIKLIYEASCPTCFIMNPSILMRADKIFPFDTGAFELGLYKHAIDEEVFDKNDFQMTPDPLAPPKLVSALYGSNSDYFDGKMSNIDVSIAAPYDLTATAYLKLLSSFGRNETDDRMSAIETLFSDAIYLEPDILAIVSPHTLMKSPWLAELKANGCEMLWYEYKENRRKEYYHTVMEQVVRGYLAEKGYW